MASDIGSCHVVDQDDQQWIQSNVYWSSVLFLSLFISVYNFTSFAYILIATVGAMMSVISLMYSRNSRGPRQLPWITPLWIGSYDDTLWLTFVHWSLSERNDFNQLRREPWTPYDSSFCKSFVCDTKSKALVKSIYKMHDVALFSRHSVQSFTDSSIGLRA